MQDRLSAGKGRLTCIVEVLSKVNSLVRKADSLYMYYAWLEAATISIVTLATFWGAGMLLSFGTTTITQQIFMAVALYYMLHARSPVVDSCRRSRTSATSRSRK